jgi:hypothetical protein
MHYPDFIPENATSYFLQLDDKQKCEITGKRNTYNIPKSHKVNVKMNLQDLSELIEKQIILMYDPDLFYSESIKNNDKLVKYFKSLDKADLKSVTPLLGYIYGIEYVRRNNELIFAYNYLIAKINGSIQVINLNNNNVCFKASNANLTAILGNLCFISTIDNLNNECTLEILDISSLIKSDYGTPDK